MTCESDGCTQQAGYTVTSGSHQGHRTVPDHAGVEVLLSGGLHRPGGQHKDGQEDLEQRRVVALERPGKVLI